MEKTKLKKIVELDSKDMLSALINFPRQLKEALNIVKKVSVASYKKKYSNIVFLGLGGSSIGAEIIRTYLIDECPVPIYVARDYNIPAFVDKNTLVFAVSYSGNTEETLSMVRAARKKKANIISVTTGGSLSRISKKNSLLAIEIPGGLPPRCALGYTLIPPLIILGKLGIVSSKEKEVTAAINSLRIAANKEFSPSALNNMPLKIAKRIHGRVPVIHGGPKHTDAIALRWKGQINENAKTMASSNVYSELDHNEIVGWYNPHSVLKKFIIITLKDKDDHKKITKRVAVTNDIFKKAGFEVLEIISKGKKLFTRMMYLVLLGDYVSFYLAIISNIDPTPIERISYLKDKLKG